MSQNSHSALIDYPVKAKFGRTLPKSKIYEHSGASARLKALFVEQVEQIVWQYKLAPETINLPAKPRVPEIQVFAIRLKTPELHHDVLRCIDGAVQFPIIFELSYGEGEEACIQVIAAYKRPSETDTTRWVLSDYFATEWLPTASPRTAMPLALDLAGLYEQLLKRLVPLAIRPQETLIELMDRMHKVQVLRREVDRMALRLDREKQFNRKVEINTALRKLKSELEQLRSVR